MDDWISVRGTVVEGHGVASGAGDDSRFPRGTLALQRPIFEDRGIDLDSYYLGTLNVSIAPHTYVVRRPRVTLRGIKWTDHFPPEDFSFFDCRVVRPEKDRREGLIYYPHPDTKPDHFQSPDVLEIITGYIPDITRDDPVIIECPSDQLGVEINA